MSDRVRVLGSPEIDEKRQRIDLLISVPVMQTVHQSRSSRSTKYPVTSDEVARVIANIPSRK